MSLRSKILHLIAPHAGLAGLLLFVAGGVVLLLQPTDAAWWAARLLGLAALLSTAVTLVLRPTAGRPSRHKLLGWVALAALLGHIAVVAGLQPVFWNWLTLAVPVEIMTGIVAVAAFAVALVIQRSRGLRLKLGPVSQRIHRFASYVLVLAAGSHIALSAGMGVVVMIFLWTGSAILVFEGIVRERHGAALVATLALFIAVTAALTVGPLAGVRLEPLRQSPIDHANFLHGDHTGLACASCHHNFLDGTGKENCLTCHKRTTMSEAMRIDRVFHAFCADCHRADKQSAREFGPIDDCNGCHRKPAEAAKK
jgi:hypothetical protein